MPLPQVVLDTNVLVTSLRSSRGASFKLISLLRDGRFEIHLSVPLAVEYEEVLERERESLGLSHSEVGDFLDYLCRIAHLHEMYFLWRPFLPDPKDEMILDLAVKARCHFIVTYNKSDFRGVEQFGIRAVTSKEFLQEMGELQ
ncbi:putative toxin-antitoxin system toxin component, PIN family [soil metagenome]|jgi:putative PIN family toxin of toxin-antitoxin system